MATGDYTGNLTGEHLQEWEFNLDSVQDVLRQSIARYFQNTFADQPEMGDFYLTSAGDVAFELALDGLGKENQPRWTISLLDLVKSEFGYEDRDMEIDAETLRELKASLVTVCEFLDRRIAQED